MLSPSDFLGGVATLTDPAEAFKRWAGGCDGWQSETLSALVFERCPFLILYCSRQVGKSSVLAAGAYMLAELVPGTFVVIGAPAERQSSEVLLKLRSFRQSLHASYDTEKKDTEHEMRLRNGSRILIVTTNQKTSRGLSQIDVLFLDEAARIEDSDIQALIPALKDAGTLALASTPAGRNGFYYEAMKAKRGRIITARSTELPRKQKAVERDKGLMSSQQFAVEHLLEWGGGTSSVFNMATIRGLSCDRPALRL